MAITSPAPPFSACSTEPAHERFAARQLRDRRHRPDRVLQGIRAQRAAIGVRSGQLPRSTTPAWQPSDVDGMVTFTMDSSDEIDIARNVGIGDLSFFSRVHHGGGAAAGTVVHAAMAVASGVADVVVCWRAFNERSGFRFGGSGRTSAETPLFMAHYAPFGLLTPAAWVAMHAQRYMSTYGVTNEDFGRIAVVDRATRGQQPRRVVLPASDHAGRPPEFALDHRTGSATARLLPGKRRRRRAGDHQRRTRPRPAAAAGDHHRGRPGRGRTTAR